MNYLFCILLVYVVLYQRKVAFVLKNALKVIAKFFSRAFCFFTIITVAVCIFGMCFNVTDLSSYLVFSFLAFSGLLALSLTVSDFIKYSSVIRNTVKFVLSYASLVVVFFLGGPLANHVTVNSTNGKGFTILAVSLVFVVIYALIGVVVLVANLIKNKISNSNKEYEKQFDNQK